MYSTHSEGPKSTFHMSWAQSRRKFRTSRRQRNGLWPTSKVDHPLASPHSRKFSVLIWSWGLQSCHVCPVVEPRCLLRNLICCIRVFVWFGEYLPKLKDSNIETLIFRRNTSIVKMQYTSFIYFKPNISQICWEVARLPIRNSGVGSQGGGKHTLDGSLRQIRNGQRPLPAWQERRSFLLLPGMSSLRRRMSLMVRFQMICS